MNIACTSCGYPPDSLRITPGRFGSGLTTAYRCRHCDHWNDLKRRKGWKEYKEAMEKPKEASP